MDINDENPEILTEAEKIALIQFRDRVADLNLPFDNYEYVKWLRARHLNISKAEKMLREHSRFRKNTGWDTILNDYKLPEIITKYFPEAILGCDKDGDCVLGYGIGQADIKGFMRSLTMVDRIKSSVYISAACMQTMRIHGEKTGKQGRRFVLIYDLIGVKLSLFMDPTVWKYVIDHFLMLESNYPENLKKFYFINAPKFFDSYFSTIKKFFDPRPLSKISVFGKDGWKEELLKNLGEDLLPLSWGGKHADVYENTHGLQLFIADTKIPTSYYLDKPCMTLEPGMTKVTIRERGFYHHPVHIHQEHSVIRWMFYTLHYNIAFAVYYLRDGEKQVESTAGRALKRIFSRSSSGHEILLPLERLNANNIPERGEMECKKSGTYLLLFDNSFSWITPKELHFKVKVEPPVEISKSLENCQQ